MTKTYKQILADLNTSSLLLDGIQDTLDILLDGQRVLDSIMNQEMSDEYQGIENFAIEIDDAFRRINTAIETIGCLKGVIK